MPDSDLLWQLDQICFTRNHRPVLEERIPVIKDKPLIRQHIDISRIENTIKEFY